MSADELIADDALNGSPKLVEWLDDYIWRWNNAETIGTKQFAIEGEPISTLDLIAANEHDDEVLDWLACAEIGEYFGGITILQRIS